MKQINAVGDACPTPVIKAKRELEAMPPGTLEVLVDNYVAVENLKRLASSLGCGFQSAKQEEALYRVTIEKAGEFAPQSPEAGKAASGKTIAVISSGVMGTGDDALGKILMKGFVFALTQLDFPPDTVLLYNGGALLSIEGSDALPDLLALERAGAEILTCGTCLNHYGVTDKLRVGSATNLYAIVEAQRKAARILRP